jgi:hypothetical protein
VSSSSFLVNMTGKVGHIVNPMETDQSLNYSYQYLPDSVIPYMYFTSITGLPQYYLNSGNTYFTIHFWYSEEESASHSFF